MTVRDNAWHTLLLAIYSHNEFRLSDLDWPEDSYATLRRVAREMENKGWLSRSSPNSSVWRRGPLADALLASQEWRDIDISEIEQE